MDELKLSGYTKLVNLYKLDKRTFGDYEKVKTNPKTQHAFIRQIFCETFNMEFSLGPRGTQNKNRVSFGTDEEKICDISYIHNLYSIHGVPWLNLKNTEYSFIEVFED